MAHPGSATRLEWRPAYGPKAELWQAVLGQLGLVVCCVGIRNDEEVVGSRRNLTVRLEIHDALASRSRPLAIRHHETVVGCARIEQLCASETQPGVWYTEPNASVIPLGTDEVIE